MNNSEVCVPVNVQQFLILADFLKESGGDKEIVDVVAEAIDYWMDNASWKTEALMPDVLRNADKGYHWKNVFLPNGTSIRMKYKNDFYYAAVQGDQVVYDGEHVSPSEFANTVTNTSRNAWNDIWIKRPSDFEWVFANTLRNQVA